MKGRKIGIFLPECAGDHGAGLSEFEGVQGVGNVCEGMSDIDGIEGKGDQVGVDEGGEDETQCVK